MKKLVIIISLVIPLSLFSMNLKGKWVIYNKNGHPVTFIGKVGYKIKVMFTDKEIFVLKSLENKQLFNTNYLYTYKDHKLSYYPRTKNTGIVHNLIMKYSSLSKTFVLLSENQKCLELQDTKNKNNIIMMCKFK